MKKITVVLLSLIMVMSTVILSGCAEAKSVDDQFKESWQKGLSARWALTTVDENDPDKVLARADYEGYIDAELNEISRFKEETFEDENLGTLAKSYIEVLEKARESLSGFGTDKWDKDWENIRQDRLVLFVQLGDAIQPEFSDKTDVANYESMISEGKVVTAVREIKDTTKFKKVADDYGWVDYEATIKNETGVDFSYFSFDINLIDKDGVVIETQSASTDNWSADSTHKFTFSTDAEFDKMEIASCLYDY